MRSLTVRAIAILNILPLLMFYSVPLSAGAESSAISSDFRSQVEHDWFLQEQARAGLAILPQEDAAGGCDGVIDGMCDFCTPRTANMWWQVDLGESKSVEKVVIWNCAGGRGRAAKKLMVRLSGDAEAWETVYRHTGEDVGGIKTNDPLSVSLGDGAETRFVRIEIDGPGELCLDEVQVFGPESETNLALNQPANQSGFSPRSVRNILKERPVKWTARTQAIFEHCLRLVGELREAGVDAGDEERAARQMEKSIASLAPDAKNRKLYNEIRWVQRRLTLKNPLLDFDSILFNKRTPGTFNHMSDQYYGWFSRPGGGIYTLRGFRDGEPSVECLTDAFKEAGSFLRPSLSYDGKKVLFAWCKFYEGLKDEKNKLDKSNVPEDAFYSIYEMNVDGTGVRQLTDGKYDDFDAQYLPDGRIVFLSTRRGWALQPGRDSAMRTLTEKALPDCYVRCGGNPKRPVPVYTLHRLDPGKQELVAISAFENFEWTPAIADDGSIMYSRWDYVDRFNNAWMSLWKINPDGTNLRLVFGNHVENPQCTFEARNIPGSNKIVFTGAPHHGQTMGSLVLLDTSKGVEGVEPMTRITPDAPFPEKESWQGPFYATPWPLSERHYLVSWGLEPKANQEMRVCTPNALGLYLLDTAGNMELLFRDPEITSTSPIPIRPRPRPHVLPDTVDWDAPKEGSFYVQDIYRGLESIERGSIKSLRVVGMPVKVQPRMNQPCIGLTAEDPGKFVLGAVPVEEDGSANFRVPSGINVFFQALDENGIAVQTMRTATHVQPGETRGCIGCHESRTEAPPMSRMLALTRAPSKLTPGPSGSWPLRYDKLVQPVLDRNCVSCHNPQSEDSDAASFDLTETKSYESLTLYPPRKGINLHQHMSNASQAGKSEINAGAAQTSSVLKVLRENPAHAGLNLSRNDMGRLTLWMDVYAQKLGHFSDEQEQEIIELRNAFRDMLIEPPSPVEQKHAMK
jgi:hypothetical protein